MAEHFKEVCRVCLKVISQCRCMDCNKTTRYGFCDDHSETKPSPQPDDLKNHYDSAVGQAIASREDRLIMDASKESPQIEPPGDGVKKRPGLKFIAAAPEDEEIVAMTLHQFTVYVATSKGVYRLIDDKLEPLG